MNSGLIKQGKDSTLERNNIKYWLHLIDEYELVKNKKHGRFRFVTDLYLSYGIKRQNFIKYYNRYKLGNHCGDYLLPQKRGPKYHSRRVAGFIEEKVVNLRGKGLSKYEISNILKPRLGKFTPCHTTIYNISKRNGLNKLKPKMRQEKVQRIIKENPGDMGHVDCHYLPKGIIEGDNKRYYFVAIIDDCTRIAWAEVVEDIKSLTVMFASLKAINLINSEYQIQFKEILSDNGPEFGSGKSAKNEDTNPFKRMLKELGIKQRFTRPYRPQTNGKIERFWKTAKEELLEDMVFDNLEHLQNELMQYMIYYNHQRVHQGIDGKTPCEFNLAWQENNKK
jgi:transposase InsO family protein